jgi:hypothetical protein
MKAVGRQVRFFNFPDDAAAFESFAVGGNGSTIIRAMTPTPEPSVVPTLHAVVPGGLLIVRPSDLPRLRWRHIPARDLWTVDKDSSPVVEYTPGYTEDGRPKFPHLGHAHGRLWFQTSHWEGDVMVEPDPEFLAWADRMFRWFKKHWILIDGGYYSPSAAELWNRMWRVVMDEPCEGTGADQIYRWQRENNPDNLLPRDAVHIAISKATREQPRWLTISVRTESRADGV